jgi:hypothetical protein
LWFLKFCRFRTRVKLPYFKIAWSIFYFLPSRSRIFHSYGDVTIAGEGLQNWGLCLALRAFEQGGIFIVSHLLWNGTSVFSVSSEGPLHLIASYDTTQDTILMYWNDPQGRLIYHHISMYGTFLVRPKKKNVCFL